MEFVDRQPRRLRRVGGLLAHCDARGSVDQRRQREGMRLALDVSADGRSPESTEIGSPPTTSQNVPSPMGNREEGPRAGTGGLHDDSSTGEARCLSLRHRRAAGGAPADGAPGRAAGWAAGAAARPARQPARSVPGAGGSAVDRGGVERRGDLRELQAQGVRRAGSRSCGTTCGPSGRCGPSRATVRFETEPGRQLQTDWGEQRTVIAGQAVTVHFAVSTLGYSRRFHFWGTDSEDAEHTYEALVRAFEWFGGVPGEVLVDNQKCAVIAHPPRRRGPLPSALSGSGGPLRLPPAGLSPGAGPDQGQGRAQRRLRQAPLLRPLPGLRELGPSQPAGRAVAAGGSRPARARHRPRGRGRALRPGSPDAAAAAGPPVRHRVLGAAPGRLGRLRRGPRQSLQRARRRWPAARCACGSPWTAPLGDLRRRAVRRSARPAAAGAAAGSPCPITMPPCGPGPLAVERRPLAVYEEVATWN